MKTYYLIVSLLAVIGLSQLLSDYPILIGLISFGIAIGYSNELHILKQKTDKQ